MRLQISFGNFVYLLSEALQPGKWDWFYIVSKTLIARAFGFCVKVFGNIVKVPLLGIAIKSVDCSMVLSSEWTMEIDGKSFLLHLD